MEAHGMWLATFVHISDLHIGLLGEKFQNLVLVLGRRWPRLNGLLGHAPDSLEDVETFLDDFRGEEPEARLIVTGDLTSMGHPKEFDIADQYLAGNLYDRLGQRAGLQVPDWRRRAIPGNHDHWLGIPFPVGGPPTPAFRRYFCSLPLAEPVFSVGSGRQVRLLRIDTDADVNPSERISAQGSFVSELDTLTAKTVSLGQKENEIRVVCLHHSPSYRDPVGREENEINAKSRDELNKFIVQNRVAILLCGHIHRPPWAKPYRVNSSLEVLEACCGTTTQIDPSIHPLRPLEDLIDPSWPNSLLVHRLLEGRGEIHWETELYFEGRGGFIRADRLLDGIAAVTRFNVWPWPPRMLTGP